MPCDLHGSTIDGETHLLIHLKSVCVRACEKPQVGLGWAGLGWQPSYTHDAWTEKWERTLGPVSSHSHLGLENACVRACVECALETWSLRLGAVDPSLLHPGWLHSFFPPIYPRR